MVENTVKENNERIVNKVETPAVLCHSIWKLHRKWSAEGSGIDNDADNAGWACQHNVYVWKAFWNHMW